MRTAFPAGLIIILLSSFSGCKKIERIKSEVPPVIIVSESVRFAVIGDYGEAGDPESRVAQMVKGWNPDFIITPVTIITAKGKNQLSMKT